MMDDKTMLELAARAAGFKHFFYSATFGDVTVANDMASAPFGWNPLTDDGDALRLAVKLRLVVDASDYPSIDVQYKHGGKYWILTEDSGDASVDARRAIVRAAAEIGKGMGEGVI